MYPQLDLIITGMRLGGGAKWQNVSLSTEKALSGGGGGGGTQTKKKIDGKFGGKIITIMG